MTNGEAVVKYSHEIAYPLSPHQQVAEYLMAVYT